MKKEHTRGFQTRSLHVKTLPYLNPRHHVMPPALSSTYAMAGLEDLPPSEYMFKYPRIATPNGVLLEQTLASLDGGEAAVVTADGMRAISVTLASLMDFSRPGTIVCSTPLYSDTYHLITKDFKRMRKHSAFLRAEWQTTDLQAILEAERKKKIPRIEVLYIESPANPTLAVYNINALARLVLPRGIPVVVDSTFATQYNQRPLELGVDIVIHSLTKYCSGNGTTLAGAVIGSREMITHIRARNQREGGHLNPFGAWLVQLGLQTFGLRMRAHNHNALRLARFLEGPAGKGKIARVYYPGLPSHPQHDIARAQMRTPQGHPGYGGMVSFEIAKPEWVQPFADYLARHSFIELAVSLGSTGSTFTVPARSVHAGISEHERDALGISDTLVRFSCGVEDWDDIRRDIQKALGCLK